MLIRFNDGIERPIIRAMGGDQLVTSEKDMIQDSVRKILTIHFDSTTTAIQDLYPYYFDSDNNSSFITIIDDEGNPFAHKDYVIAEGLGFAKIDGDPNVDIVLQLAKLTETDKTLRNIAGEVKVYTGTPLQIAIAKKKDEIASICNKTIVAGVIIDEKRYSLTQYDQTNINSRLALANAGESVPYHADGGWYELYSPKEFKKIAKAANDFILSNTTYSNLLSRWVETLNDIEEVERVTYGVTQLEGEYLERFNEITGDVSDE